jgi:ATP-binding cassette subfamily C protein
VFKKKTSMKPDDVSAFKKVLYLLPPKDRRKFVQIQVFSIVVAFAQSAGIGSFIPFINLLLDIDSVNTNSLLNWAYTTFRFQSTNQFVIAVGSVVAILILTSNGLAVISNLMKNRFTHYYSHEMSCRMLATYLDRPYAFILKKNTSELTKNILSDIMEFTHNYLKSITDLLTNIIMMSSIIILLLLVNVQVTILIFLFFGATYGILTAISRGYLQRSGKRIIEANREKYIYAAEALNSFKILKVIGAEDFFIRRYTVASKKFARQRIIMRAISDLPKFVMDALVFGGITAAIVFFIIRGGDLTAIISTISVYILAGYRMMPELAAIFTSISGIQHYRPILDKIYHELAVEGALAPVPDQPQPTASNAPAEALTFARDIQLQDIVFQYEESDTIIDHLTLTIPKGAVIGFAGTTGAGKTTLIDIMLGLHAPVSGGLYVDSQRIEEANVRAWRKMIGYVPQEIYLIDDTIRANIAYGIPVREIDDERIRLAAKIAAIDQFIETELPEGYQTMVGERGVRLSGGQRQRLGLARALYRQPEFLVLDEATSALDGATEASVVRSIHELSQVRTIVIIAHRLNTLKACDQIYLLEKGQIIDQGTYDELLGKSDTFRKMAKVETHD